MKLSIITISYNNLAGLHKTVESVLAQTYRDFEYIIIDGASTDGSREYLNTIQTDHSQADNRLANLHIISEPDTGIYNAMNKGIRFAHGEYCLFLNSGDTLYNSSVCNYFQSVEITADIASGIETFANGRMKYPPKCEYLSYEYFYKDTLMHQSTFIRRSAFDKYGMYVEKYRIVSDWEWFFRTLIRDNATYQELDFVVAEFDEHGISRNADWVELQNYEIECVHNTILPRLQIDYFELQKQRMIVKEYLSLRNGKFGLLIKLMLQLKKNRRKWCVFL